MGIIAGVAFILFIIFFFCSVVWGSWAIVFFITNSGLVASLVAFFIGLFLFAAWSDEGY